MANLRLFLNRCLLISGEQPDDVAVSTVALANIYGESCLTIRLGRKVIWTGKPKGRTGWAEIRDAIWRSYGDNNESEWRADRDG